MESNLTIEELPPDPIDTIEDDLDKFLKLTENDRTRDYLAVLKETNALVKKLMTDINDLHAQLRTERTYRNAIEDKLLLYRETGNSNITRYLFNSYVLASKERTATHLEWIKFTQSFRFSEDMKLNKEIYAWIDANLN
jgi:hypothetical protein